MLSLKLYGDKQGEKFWWSITVIDSRGKYLTTEGLSDTEEEARACMRARLGDLIDNLVFSPVDPVDESDEEVS